MKKIMLLVILMLGTALLIADNWTEDFNSQTGSSYIDGTIDINGRTWSASDAGNFSYANTSMGSYAFTINDDKPGANITSPALNTCGMVSFKYAYKNGTSTNVFLLQKSTDGTNFTTIDTHTLGDSSNENYIDYSFDVNDSSNPIYIRILSDDQDAHLFIEDYSVTDYSTLPVELSSFSAVFTSNNFVTLNWITQTETDFMGFDILRNTNENSSEAIKVNSTLIAGTNTSQETSYNFTDKEIDLNQTYYYWLRILNNNGTSELSEPLTVKTFGNNDTPDIPETTKLGNAYPNPFNPETHINFSISENSNVNLSIYNVLGQKVKTFYNQEMKAGKYSVTWTGLDENNSKCSSGIYFYILQTNNFKSIKKMLLLK